MAFVALDANGNITTIFGVAQLTPPAGYAVIDDADPRIATFQSGEKAASKAVNMLGSLTTTEQTALVNHLATVNVITAARATQIINAASTS